MASNRPLVIKTVQEMQREADGLRMAGKRIGFVPTMGALHEGHLSLIRRAKAEADVTVVSIFVNPTQFGPGEDLAAYPRDFERDEALCASAGADVIFYPSPEEMYPHPFHTYVQVDHLTEGLCGASRPTHFRGVTTVVTKLFNAVKPHVAVFGQKDYQQAAVIRRMAADLNLDVAIVTAPIVREADGLAMSSRNAYLSNDERREALALSQSLALAEEAIHQGERDVQALRRLMADRIEAEPHARIDYIALVHPDTLEVLTVIGDRVVIALAVVVGKTRLIDNKLIEI